MEKREKFAVGLRKKKTHDLVKAKRRKIAESQSKKLQETLSAVNSQSYQGYGPWRGQPCEDYPATLRRFATDEEWDSWAKEGREIELINKCIEFIGRSDCSEKELLALLARIRAMFSSAFDDRMVYKICDNTKIILVCSQAIALDINAGTEDPVTKERWTRYLWLEALWILSNLAFGPPDLVERILAPELGVLAFLDKTLRNETDPRLYEQILWFIANAAGDSAPIRAHILQKVCIIEAITNYVNQRCEKNELVYNQVVS